MFIVFCDLLVLIGVLVYLICWRFVILLFILACCMFMFIIYVISFYVFIFPKIAYICIYLSYIWYEIAYMGNFLSVFQYDFMFCDLSTFERFIVAFFASFFLIFVKKGEICEICIVFLCILSVDCMELESSRTM